ncbi:MAG TPA: class I SAM-dependent methyltransferase [Solirubrobacteraceae bacterium]|jgi:SAM-dependent methyltransferase|nr:class I SAM-dependent methyltransferase [Solirubrobacteraceae bacterium]
MDELYERQTHEVEDLHWWYRGRRRVIAEALHRLRLSRDIAILDAGCGSGRNMVDLAAFGRVTGLELADASVARARERGVGDVVQGTLDAMPFAADSFDLAVSFDVIEHLEDDQRALAELRRVVRPGGTLLVTVPAYPRLWSQHDVVNHHFRRYTLRTLEAVTAATGWKTVSSTHFNGILLPAAVAHRGLQRLRPPSDDALSDLERTPRRLNGVLEWPLLLEARLVAAGVRIPAGLSLMALFN